MTTIYKALTIAGSDTSGGAGIQADLKTFQELGVYGMTALTVIVAQDPSNDWNHQLFPLPHKMLKAQLKTVLDGIGVHALKTGMLGSVELIELVAYYLDKYHPKNVVVDPVMVCKGTNEALHPEIATALRDILLQRAMIATPNLFEASQITRQPVQTIQEMKNAAQYIHDLGTKYVLIKDGAKLNHEKAVDLLYDGKQFELFEADKINTSFTHGAGCTYSAAITAELAKGSSIHDAVKTAKTFVTAAIEHSFKLNSFVGSTNHSAYRHQKS